MNKTKIIIMALFSVGLTACATGPYGQPTVTRQQVGTVAGGVAGGALGSQIFKGAPAVGAVGGAVLGALLGGAIGQSMDEQDKINAHQAIISTPMGQEAVWTNPRTKTSYTVRPVNDYRSGSAYCRQAQVMIDGGKQTAYATVCRGPDGKWYVKQ